MNENIIRMINELINSLDKRVDILAKAVELQGKNMEWTFDLLRKEIKKVKK